MTVGIVIVSHSPKVAEGTADMVRQMVGTMVPLGWCGGDGQGGLGSDVGAILKAIEAAWSDDGVAVLVDLGGAAMQAEMAIELLHEGRRARVQICEAPLVEGAVIGATEASSGSDLAAVRAVAASALGAATPPARPASAADATPPAPDSPEPIRRGQAELVNAVGLHARPAVRFTQTAKSFQSRIEVALAATGPWADAKSPVQVMRLRAGQGRVLHLQVKGPDADAALDALLQLIRQGFVDSPGLQSSRDVENSLGVENSRGVEKSRG